MHSATCEGYTIKGTRKTVGTEGPHCWAFHANSVGAVFDMERGLARLSEVVFDGAVRIGVELSVFEMASVKWVLSLNRRYT